MLWNKFSIHIFKQITVFFFIIRSDSQAESQSEVKEVKTTEKEKEKREDSPKMVIYSDDEDDLDGKSKSVRRLKRKRVLEFSGRSHNKIILHIGHAHC